MSEQPKKRVLVVDDHQMVAEALGAMLEMSDALQVVGIATSGVDAVSKAVDSRPDVLLLDVQLPDRCGFDIADDIRRRIGRVPTVFISGTVSDLNLSRSLMIDGAGFLLKGRPAAMLIDCVQRAAAGEQVFCDEIRERLERDPKTGRWRCKRQSELMMLTARQLDVLRHLARGLSVKEIAALMHLSEKAVDSQKYRIMQRLDLHDRVELSRLAIREGLLEP